jgi:hypothetical protein
VITIKVVGLDAKYNSLSNGGIFNQVIGQKMKILLQILTLQCEKLSIWNKIRIFVQ